MTWQVMNGRRGKLLAAATCTAILAIAAGSHLAAQDAPAPASEPATEVPKPKKHHVARKAAPKPAEARDVAEAAAPPASPPAKPGTGTPPKAPESVDFAAQLDKAGASVCHGQVNALAASTMGNVVAFNTMSNWSEVAGGKRAVTVSIGQKYAEGSAVPFSVSQIISAPNQQGSCDGFSVQVFPSPLPCGKLRETMAGSGKQIGDLAGVSLMQDSAGRALLVPTAANTCVLVATRTAYSK